MSIQSWNLILVVGLLVVLAGGSGVLYSNHLQQQAEIEQARLEAEAKEREEAERKAALDKANREAFNAFLDEFLSMVSTEVREYKKSRIVLNDLLKTENLRETEYIEENARMAESMAMDLQLQMREILGLFEGADARAELLLEKFDDEKRVEIEPLWAQMREENFVKYNAFFTSEQDVIMAQLELIEFYKNNLDTISVDVVNDRVLFDDVENQEEAALLKGRVMEMRVLQKGLIANNSEN